MSKEEIKTKSELMDSFVQLAIAKGYSDYSGDAERFINETVSIYENLPECKQPKLSIPKKIAEEVDEFAHTNWANWQFYFYSDEMSEDLIDWLDNGDSEFTNAKIALAYLNPLTRAFVEVTGE